MPGSRNVGGRPSRWGDDVEIDRLEAKVPGVVKQRLNRKLAASGLTYTDWLLAQAAAFLGEDDWPQQIKLATTVQERLPLNA